MSFYFPLPPSFSFSASVAPRLAAMWRRRRRRRRRKPLTFPPHWHACKAAAFFFLLLNARKERVDEYIKRNCSQPRKKEKERSKKYIGQNLIWRNCTVLHPNKNSFSGFIFPTGFFWPAHPAAVETSHWNKEREEEKSRNFDTFFSVTRSRRRLFSPPRFPKGRKFTPSSLSSTSFLTVTPPPWHRKAGVNSCRSSSSSQFVKSLLLLPPWVLLLFEWQLIWNGL